MLASKILSFCRELDHDNISFSEVQLPLSTREFKVFGSCIGIICIANNDEILLFNPLTKSHFQVSIPKPNRVTRSMLGFGYDSKSEDYKILKLSHSDDMDWKSVEAKLYSRNYNSWKSVQEDEMHFIKIYIWVMKEYGNNESWVRLFSIGNECIPRLSWIMPIVYSKDGKKILLDIYISEFGWYDLESKKIKAIKPHGLPKRPTMGYHVGCFVGSLVSIEDKLQSERETLPMIKKK
uniref:F-box associated beta-propeller type 1 domain-containing protein n=1 Tax=Chenopodium quinoa TaxID=63459 RepID=A0A803LRF6_CHEQI